MINHCYNFFRRTWTCFVWCGSKVNDIIFLYERLPSAQNLSLIQALCALPIVLLCCCRNLSHRCICLSVLRYITALQSKLHIFFSFVSLFCVSTFKRICKICLIFQQNRRESCKLGTLLSADVSEKLHWNSTALVYCLQESIEQRLEALDIDVSKIKTPGGLPQTDSFAVLLVQGLESNDAEILNVSVTRSLYAV